MIIMVLDDGETYSELSGCKMVQVPDAWDAERIEEALRALRDDDPVPEMSVICEFN